MFVFCVQLFSMFKLLKGLIVFFFCIVFLLFFNSIVFLCVLMNTYIYIYTQYMFVFMFQIIIF